MVFNDRLKRAFYALFKASVPRLDYYARYSGRVVRQNGANAMDVQPDDSRIPPMAAVSLKHGTRGQSLQFPPGSSVMVGWENADPARPYCESWGGGETDTICITLVANKIELGGSGLDPIQAGALNGQAVDPYTGLQHWQLGNASQVVLVKK